MTANLTTLQAKERERERDGTLIHSKIIAVFVKDERVTRT